MAFSVVWLCTVKFRKYAKCCFTLYLRAISKYKPLGGLYLEGRFNGGFFALRVWGGGGLYLEGLISGILRDFFSLLGGETHERIMENEHNRVLHFCLFQYNVHRGYYTVARRYEFIFEWQSNILRTSAASKMLFCHEKIKFIS